jgi:hypothetical protein
MPKGTAVAYEYFDVWSQNCEKPEVLTAKSIEITVFWDVTLKVHADRFVSIITSTFPFKTLHLLF